MEGEIIERLGEYMRYAGLNDNQVTVQCGLSNSIIGNARKRGKSLNGKNIVKIISTYRDLNARWFLTGEGDMLVSESYPTESAITQFLKNQNRELMEKVESLNREIGELRRRLTETGYRRLDMASDSEDDMPYGLNK